MQSANPTLLNQILDFSTKSWAPNRAFDLLTARHSLIPLAKEFPDALCLASKMHRKLASIFYHAQKCSHFLNVLGWWEIWDCLQLVSIRLNSTGTNDMPEEIALVKVECNACFDQTLKYGF